MLAYEKAKVFYERLILKKYQHPAHLSHHVVTKPVVVQADHSFKEIATQWLARQATRWTPAHKYVVEKRLEYNLFPYIAKRKIQLITKADLLGLLQKIEARGAYNLPRRLLNDCRQIWRYAMVLDICKNDITIGLGDVLHSHTVVHQKAVSIEELPDLMRTIANYAKEDDRICCYALQLIALTFVRKS